MLKRIVRYRATLLGILLGAVAGYAWYYFVGCSSGTCPITSRPINSTLYGALMGFLLAHSFTTKEEKKNEQQTENNH